jgi:triosephosphate isomerase
VNVLVVNFKTYKEATGTRAVELAKKLSEVSDDIILCPQATDISRIADEVANPIFAQHVDVVPLGQSTGHVTPHSVLEAGAEGTLINHSEKPLSLQAINNTVKACREAGLRSLVCASSAKVVSDVKEFRPDFIAVEPPELIGSGVSVSKARPELISQAVAAAGAISLLCGAGISNGEDVKKAVALGAKGVLAASAIVKAENPVKLAREMTGHL